MKSDHNSCNQSAIKRIIPAVAMFALSAVMLSSSTYAWFTMNKEVEMTGLNMTATVGSGMEIALASVNGNGAINNTNSPNDESADEKGWTSSVVVGQYYSDIGKLRPASSIDGENLFDAKDASSGGGTATQFEPITLDGNMAQVTMRSELYDAPNPTINSNGKVGYYVDIPVYLRTNKVAPENEDSAQIYCKMKIRDTNGKNLYKAVRVAFIKDSSSTNKIFGIDGSHYGTGPASSKTEKTSVTVLKDFVTNEENFTDGKGEDTGLTIPFATGTEDDKYGVLAFKVRVWIEGESTFCSDATSGQDWNIDLAFAMGEFETTNTTP